jgi:hypothetical protein
MIEKEEKKIGRKKILGLVSVISNTATPSHFLYEFIRCGVDVRRKKKRY